MKIVLFIIFNLITTYNTYANCSDLIKYQRFMDIQFQLHNPRKESIKHLLYNKEDLVEAYLFDDSSYFVLYRKEYLINSCTTNKNGVVNFLKDKNKILSIHNETFLLESHFSN